MYWKGLDAVNCPNQSKLTQSQGEKWKTGKSTLAPSVTGKHIVVTILEPTQQSPPYPTIHYTYNEMLEGLRCCDILESIWKHTILVWKVGYWSRICPHPLLKAGVWWWLYMMNSNLNLVIPFIIVIMRYWKGWDAVNCPNQSKHTQSWG